MNIKDALHILEIASANYVENDKADSKESLIEQLVDRQYTDQILNHYNYRLGMDSNYTLLDAVCEVVKNASIIKHKHDIALDYISSNKSDLLVRLLSRDVYRNVVRGVLKRKNKFGVNVLRYINTDSRFDVIYYQFVKTFAKDSVGSFCDGHYAAYIANAFSSYYYEEHKRDIWNALSEVDTARQEIDMKQSLTNIELVVTDTSDFYIHDLLKNIYQANMALFKHNGHTLNTIVYDIFHLCMNHRINTYFNQINEQLKTFHLELIDTGRPQLTIDEESGKVIEDRVKGASSKIGNGLKMIPVLYDYVRAKRLNMNALGDLREYAFTLGKDAVSDSNCLWQLEPIARGTEKRIDNSDGIKNYKNFEVVLKGVISVYSLINGLESRGVSPVSMYDEDLFKNIEVIRYMDYLSSLKYKDLMLELQNVKITPENDCSVLDNFEAAVHNRAGSSENNRADNQERRAKALLNGLLVNPPLKKQKIYSEFDNLYHTYLQISLFPRSLDLYKILQLEGGAVAQRDVNNILQSTELPSAYIGSSLVRSNRCNKLLKSKPYLTNEYLTTYHPVDLNFSITLPALLEETLPCLLFQGNEVPLNRESNSFDLGDTCYDYNDVLELYQSAGEDRDFDLIDKPILVETEIPLFDIRLQLSDSYTSNHISKMKSALKYKFSKDACERFNVHYIELSALQEDFISFLNEMKDFLSLAYQYSEFLEVCSELSNEFKQKEFKEEILGQFVLNTIARCCQVESDSLNADDLLENNKQINSFIRIMLLSLSEADKRAYTEQKELYNEFLSFIDWDEVNTPSKVFVLFWNYINAKLLFFSNVRDIYDVLFLVPSEVKTLTSELCYRYKLESVLPDMVSAIPDGISLDTISNALTIDFIKDTYKTSMDTHNFIIKLFTKYIHHCNHAFENILDYSSIGKTIMKDEFRHWGEVFSLTQKEQDIPMLNKLTELYSTDDYGFFMRNSEYFKGYSSDGNTSYFVHRSGKLLVQNLDGTYRPITNLIFERDLTEEERKAELNEIIARGLRIYA